MSLYILTLILAAALLHAFWNLLSKNAQGKAPFIWLIYVASTILYSPIIIYEIFISGVVFSHAALLLSLTSAVLHTGYYLVLQKGYRSGDLSVVYPLARGTGPLFSSVAAIAFLHEDLKLSSTIGLFLILAGVVVITGLSFKKGQNASIMAGVFWGVLTGLFIAMYTFNDAIAIKNYQISPLVITFVSSFFSMVVLAPFAALQTGEIKREIGEHKWTIIAIAVLSPAAYILILEALKFAPISIVAPARETSILIGVFMGSRILNEEDGRRRLIASALILGGIAALSLG